MAAMIGGFDTSGKRRETSAVKIDLPIPSSWKRTFDPRATGEIYQVGGVTVVVGAFERLPHALDGWGERTVLGGMAANRVRTRDVTDRRTDGGWPVTMFLTDLVHPFAETVIERRVHALYRFLEYGVAVVARASTVAAMDAAAPEIVPVLLAGRPSWKVQQVLSLAEVWEGLETRAPEGPAVSRPTG
jgi:hypothetical protein